MNQELACEGACPKVIGVHAEVLARDLLLELVLPGRLGECLKAEG